MRVRSAWAAFVAAVALLAGCTGHEQLEADPGESPSTGAVIAPLESDALLGSGSAQDLAVSASSTFFASARTVVLAAADASSQLRSASLAMVLGVPALVVGEDGEASVGVVEELERLGTTTVLVVGELSVPTLSQDMQLLRAVPAPEPVDQLQVVVNAELDGRIDVAPGEEARAIADAQAPFTWLLDYADSGEEATGDLADLPGLPPLLATERATDLIVVAQGDPSETVALGTARAAGAQVVVSPDGEIEADPIATASIYSVQPRIAVGIGDVGRLAELSYRVDVAASGTQVPGGGQQVLPDKRYLAERGEAGGSQEEPTVGGEAVTEVLDSLTTAASGWPGTTATIPTLEVYATRLAADAGPGGTYSVHEDVEPLWWVLEAARAQGAMVLLVFEPGREGWAEQFEPYADLLAQPDVGVVLELPARLSEGETPETATGTAGDRDVSTATTWLADHTQSLGLPPKLIVAASPNDPGIATTYRVEVEVVIEVDGSAVTPQPEEGAGEGADAVTADEVWRESTVSTIRYWGWAQGENPVDLDELSALTPRPVLISLR